MNYLRQIHIELGNYAKANLVFNESKDFAECAYKTFSSFAHVYMVKDFVERSLTFDFLTPFEWGKICQNFVDDELFQMEWDISLHDLDFNNDFAVSTLKSMTLCEAVEFFKRIYFYKDFSKKYLQSSWIYDTYIPYAIKIPNGDYKMILEKKYINVFIKKLLFRFQLTAMSVFTTQAINYLDDNKASCVE